MHQQKFVLFIIILISIAISSCKKEEIRQKDESYNPVIKPEDFTNSTQLTNPYFRFDASKTYIYEGQTEDGLERIVVKRRMITKEILGIQCVVVNDSVTLNGILIENTDDWYAQDNLGNVWYFGEDVKNYNTNGSFKDKHGSWEAGVDGAKPGIVMPANPQKGLAYRQEYYFNEAEDEAEIIETGLTITTVLGTFTNCIKTHDFTALEPDLQENKFYAPGIGLIKEINLTDKEEIFLIKIEN
ncbi:MAG: hypothetical protein SFU99_20445 [Saprospiraceae bacterium]|nr:hypothetical protein [Saprospiraceae bacterium]